jgi:hypothetical protein
VKQKRMTNTWNEQDSKTKETSKWNEQDNQTKSMKSMKLVIEDEVVHG